MERVVLGIDLASSTLPDAIAAMVEAWYEAQEIENELSTALCECIDYILSREIEWTGGSSIKVGKLIEIRSQQAKGSRSNAKHALYKAGINYPGKGSDEISIFSNSQVLSGIGDDLTESWGMALLAAPGARCVDYGGQTQSLVLVPARYFLARVVA